MEPCLHKDRVWDGLVEWGLPSGDHMTAPFKRTIQNQMLTASGALNTIDHSEAKVGCYPCTVSVTVLSRAISSHSRSIWQPTDPTQQSNAKHPSPPSGRKESWSQNRTRTWTLCCDLKPNLQIPDQTKTRALLPCNGSPRCVWIMGKAHETNKNLQISIKFDT